jgi:hypothetical protein
VEKDCLRHLFRDRNSVWIHREQNRSSNEKRTTISILILMNFCLGVG